MGALPRLALALIVLAALAIAPTALGGRPYSTKSETYIVQTSYGDIYVEVARPVDGDRDVKGPAIFTYSPYSVLGRNGDAARYVPRGYVRVWADVVGTGNSGGCYDYGGIREKRTGYDLVEWIARQPWSTGLVGMIGGSYNGTTANATAVMQPPHLTTIVPEAAIDRWYDYAFSGGIRYFDNNEDPSDEGVDTPLGFDFGFAIPPPLDGQDASWADRVRSTIAVCDEVEHTLHGYNLDEPNYDGFWAARDYRRLASKVTIPALVAFNWGDWNVKQENDVEMYRALVNAKPRKLYAGTRYSGHGIPGGDFAKTVDAWFDHYLMGVPNGIGSLPDVHSQMSDYDGPIGWYEGPWPNTKTVTLYAQHDAGAADYPWRLLPARPHGDDTTPATFTTTGTNTESVANANPRANAQWLWFETPRLARDVRIFGNVEVRLRSSVDRTWITYTPTILDIDLSKRVTGPGQLIATDQRGLISTTRGWLDSRYRYSLRRPAPLVPAEPFDITVVEKPQDYTFRAGHLIGLMVQTENVEWSVPKVYEGCNSAECSTVAIDWRGGRTRVTLPVVDAPEDPASLFER